RRTLRRRGFQGWGGARPALGEQPAHLPRPGQPAGRHGREADDVSRTGRPGAADLVGARGAGLPAVRRLSGEHRPRDSGLSARAALTEVAARARAACEVLGTGPRPRPIAPRRVTSFSPQPHSRHGPVVQIAHCRSGTQTEVTPSGAVIGRAACRSLGPDPGTVGACRWEESAMTLNDPAELRQWLSGVDYPAHRDALVDQAERNGAPEHVQAALRAMPPVEYADRDEVAASVHTSERQSDSEKAKERGRHQHSHLAETETEVPSTPIAEELGYNRKE